MIKIVDEKSSVVVIPTKLNEITPKVLNELTKDIKVAKHHCIVALCLKTKLFDVVTMVNNKSNSNVSVSTLLAYKRDDEQDIDANVGDIVITDRTSLERGYHIVGKSVVSSNVLQRFVAAHKKLTNVMFKREVNDIIYNEDGDLCDVKDLNDIYMIELKILPVVDIKAGFKVGYKINDPFVISKGN